ncbi:MAG: PQQ-binding-like beta-propeller repeat protein, partial [Solirubrobacteraceae bacterium]
GRFYALDARSGREVWSRGGNGKISGGATVIGDIVYYADLGNRLTVGLDARSGRKVYEHERGSYNPVVSDGRTIFLTGYHVLYALREPTAEVKKARRSAAAARAARNAKERRACAQVARQAHRGKPKAIRRSVERCVDRKRARRRAAKRHECAKVARKAHKGHQAKLRRSYERCLVRKGLRQSA